MRIMAVDELLSGPRVAALLGITATTWRSAVSQGLAPRADVVDTSVPAQRRRPMWKRSTIDAYVAARRVAPRTMRHTDQA